MTRTTPELAPPLQASTPHQREGVWPLRMIWRAAGPIHGGSSGESGFEPGTLRPQSRDLTTRPPRPLRCRKRGTRLMFIWNAAVEGSIQFQEPFLLGYVPQHRTLKKINENRQQHKTSIQTRMREASWEKRMAPVAPPTIERRRQ
ncbi:hypothetical protein AVEN_156177-1 [Araneus ventricosus]|uniref:Uncharacterized protein n=1 Tax=Araneus ventricosus TaxID=182803 RepID=A0A4Y2PCK0_ARAVE|nr:hypothetical protein AVEN_156177-1 [Araneus ventricosus]